MKLLIILKLAGALVFSPLGGLEGASYACPASDGNAVFQARVLYGLIYNDYLLFMDNCPDAVAMKMAATDDNSNNSEVDNKQNEISQPKNNVQFKLFPNPNAGTMQLQYSMEKGQKGELKIFNVSGELLKSYELSDDKTSIEIMEKDIDNGVYFYQVLINKGIVYNNRIIIIK